MQTHTLDLLLAESNTNKTHAFLPNERRIIIDTQIPELHDMFHSFFQTNPTWKLSPNKRGIMSYQTSTVRVETKQKIDSTRTHLYVREAAGHFPGRYHRVLVQKQNSIPYHAQKEGIRKTFSCSLL
jgi:hypothetical protein